MNLYRELRLRLLEAGLLPRTRVALITWYLFAFDLFLFLLQKTLGLFKTGAGQSLAGWVTVLSLVVIVLFAILAVRWLKARLLWRLRNRLIVTYVFIGVIPVVLLAALTLGCFYLFASQFATFIVSERLNSELQSLNAVNATLAHELAASTEAGQSPETAFIDGLRHHHDAWKDRQVCAWMGGSLVLNNSPGAVAVQALPAKLQLPFVSVVRDHDRLSLRAAESVPVRGGILTVVTDEPVDQHLLQSLAADLGEVSLYAMGTGEFTPTYTAGVVPPPVRALDRQVSFPTSVEVMEWSTGGASNSAVITVQTRFSNLYEHLFASLGDFASAVEFSLLVVAVVLAVIWVLAWFIGYRLTRTVTGMVAQLYEATRHINRGDFGHRISVASSDQLATLANSFNLMTDSIEKLIEEQKAKQRMENELVIAQEVQAQLFPRQIDQLPTLEVHGFCRPARTVSGDYYDFLNLDADRHVLAVGDVSGKGISAALLMATIHSAVRAYSLEGIPILREPVAVGAGLGSSMMLGGEARGPELAPGTLLALLNHQLFRSTPAEKYATLFLTIYDARRRSLTYSNGGHLPPLILGEGDTVRKLDCGGTVVGLFDHCTYDEESIQLRSGEIFLAYSDGVTEPENDFGEFGEQRLIDLVRENRDLPLARISEIVTAAVDDWIGANEQPDDVTLVLARGR